MRPDALRPATAKAAGQATAKLATRLSKGEKRKGKRIAEVGALYDLTPMARTPTDIIGRGNDPPRSCSPKASNKWLTASVVEGAATVICSIFEEAQRRDPTHQRTWVALVDGAKHQIDRIQAEARARRVQVTIVCDFIHVLEYLWSAAWSFFTESDSDAEKWVAAKALAVLKRAGLNRRRRDPAQGHHPRPRSPHPTWRRPLRRLPARQAGLPQLPAGTRTRLADRDRLHRRRLPTPGQRPARPDRRTLGTRRRRSHPETPSPTQQRRLRAVLDVPPRPGTAPGARNPLRRHGNRNRCLTSLHESRTQIT